MRRKNRRLFKRHYAKLVNEVNAISESFFQEKNAKEMPVVIFKGGGGFESKRGHCSSNSAWLKEFLGRHVLVLNIQQFPKGFYLLEIDGI